MNTQYKLPIDSAGKSYHQLKNTIALRNEPIANRIQINTFSSDTDIYKWLSHENILENFKASWILGIISKCLLQWSDDSDFSFFFTFFPHITILLLHPGHVCSLSSWKPPKSQLMYSLKAHVCFASSCQIIDYRFLKWDLLANTRTEPIAMSLETTNNLLGLPAFNQRQPNFQFLLHWVFWHGVNVDRP